VVGDDSPEGPELGVTVNFAVELGEDATVLVPAEQATIAVVTQPERQASASRFM
jgi:hypothetical protein